MKRILFVLILVIMTMGCSESMKRYGKNIQSNYGGLNRVVNVYSYDGKLLRSYSGMVDVRDDRGKNTILFDLNGKRIIISNAITIIEEK